MVWLAKKAFFGHVPFPGHACRHRQEVPRDVRVPRPLRQGVEAEPDRRGLPAARGDRSDPAAGRALGGAQDPRACAHAIAKHGFTGIIAGIRRDEEGTRAKERVFSPRGDSRPVGLPRPAAGILGPVQHRPAGRHASARPSAAALDRDRHLALHPARGHPDGRSLFRPRATASATARSATRTSPSRSTATPRRSTRSSPSSRRRRRRSAPAAPWTARPRTPSSGCAPRATCDAALRIRAGGRARPAAHRHRRPCRSRQVDPGRPPVPRHRLAARGQARGHQGDVRAARHALRMGLPHGCLPGRARPGHHHRHRADLAAHAAARLRHHRRARPPRVPQEHDHRRGQRRRRAAADRRRPGHPAAVAPPRLPPASARHPAGRVVVNKMDWWASPRRASTRSASPIPTYLDEHRLRRPTSSSRSPRATATTSSAPAATHALVRRPDR